MLECFIMGDSIAVGVANARKECHAQVQSGISSPNYLKKFGDKIEPAKIVVISLGANDSKVDTRSSLEKIRAKVKADHVVWLVPSEQRKPDEAKIVREVAKAHSDAVIERPKANLAPDGIHYTAKGYKDIADQTKKIK